ncbi:hypothetical protein P3X46_017398 [Hevea brasiliensis]|uniref:Uncharacterized protein n=1 Tax=Hevea brasiliensis TaxID=3981 RepID=A0ABQ9M2E0_HEVBR|nr:hypothetical protein P3X46_017398 [Hevea brasiliensis]
MFFAEPLVHKKPLGAEKHLAEIQHEQIPWYQVVFYLSIILVWNGPIPVHKCHWKCENEHVRGNIILYDNHSSLCRASGQVFLLSLHEEQALRGVRRTIDADSSPTDSCAFKRRRDSQFHPSPFERSFSGQVGDGMDMN